MPPVFTPQFDDDTEKELVAESRSLATVIAHLGFYTRDDQRIELDMPVPMPLARHWVERGVRYHPELAVIKPAKSEQGEQIWVPKAAGEDDDAPADDVEAVDPEQLEELKGLVGVLMDRIAEAEALMDQKNGTP
ncbi:Uncharacterised protein [Mycobacteroides abscessus subsp. abscessus]|nr:Uncharacterised protein [Mycobacteroides abscessus subsp. abscessus]